MIGHTFCAQYRLGNWSTPMLPWKSLSRISSGPLGAKAPKEGILLTYTGRSSYNSERRQCLSKLDTLHHLVRLEYVPLYPHSVLYLILFLLPPLPLMLPHSALIVIGVLLLMSGPPPPLLLYCLPALSR